MTTPVFDGHNDALMRLWVTSRSPVETFATDEGHVNAPGCRAGGMAGGFFAIFCPPRRGKSGSNPFADGLPTLDLPGPMDEGFALQGAIGQAAIAHALDAAGQIRLVRHAADLRPAFDDAPIAAVLHLEGADCIGPDLLALDALHALGLRSIGPVWSRSTIWGDGVPFRPGPDGDTGPGLTADGHRLIARCKALGLIVDTSHINLKGFWDIAGHGVPLVATHSNATALCQATRNLTDDQLRAVGDTGGMVGINYGVPFLDETGAATGRTDLGAVSAQVAHMIDVAGENHVGLGSDFDGAPMPDGLAGARDLQALVARMRADGFGEALIEKLCHGNWLRFLERSLPQA